MIVGKKYKNTISGFVVECVYNGGKHACIKFSDGSLSLVEHASGNWVEIPKEKWVVLMWRDIHKNGVITNSEIFSSEEEGFKKWDRHGDFIKVVQIE